MEAATAGTWAPRIAQRARRVQRVCTRRQQVTFVPPAPSSFLSVFNAHKASPTPAMPLAYSLPSNLSPATVTNTSSLLRIIALALISGAAIASRLFAVVNFESIIHELCV